MPSIEYNKRKSEVVVSNLNLEDALPKIPRLPYRYDSAERVLRITTPGNMTASVFVNTVILTPVKWSPTAEADSQVLFRNKQLVIFEVRQRACIGYTIAVQTGESDG